jgi:hypothetical protein
MDKEVQPTSNIKNMFSDNVVDNFKRSNKVWHPLPRLKEIEEYKGGSITKFYDILE